MKIDKLALDHFDSPEDFARAMKLMYEAALHNDSHHDFEENFWMDIEGSIDEWFYSKAISFNQSITNEFTKLQTEISFLKEAILSNESIASPQGLEKLLNTFDEKINPRIPDEKNPTIDELYILWKQYAKSNLVRSSYESTYKPAIKLFIRFINDLEGKELRINSLDVTHIRHYQTHFKNIPKGTVSARYSIPKLIKLNGKVKSGKTILDTFSNVGTFLNWIATRGYPINDNLQKVLIKGSDIIINPKDLIPRVPLADDDLTRLFNSSKYTKTCKFKTSAMYWAALISLFTGARMSEILQLERHDIKIIDGIHIISITDMDPESTDEHKHVKRDGSIREIPIHKQLLDLGFIKFCNSQKKRLFPDEPRNTKGKFDLFQKRYATYRRQVNAQPKGEKVRKDFHSYRHTVRTRLSELRTTGKPSERFDEGLIDAIIGHASRARSVGETTYNHAQYIKAKKKALDQLEYTSIDFSKIVSWDKCDFVRNQKRIEMRQRLKQSK